MWDWTPELLDEMRQCGDTLADDAVARAAAVPNVIAEINKAFQSFAADDAGIPANAPKALLDFVAATRALPPGLDHERIERGARAIQNNAVLCALTLLLKSLPAGYAAPRLSTILHLTHNLEDRPYRRALGVLQMLVNIWTPGAFREGGRAVVTAQKLRLLHAGVRRIVGQRKRAYRCLYGTPVSQLDMVFTAMTFSVHVIDGLAELGVPMSAAEADDYFYLWRMYGQMQGIRPEWMPLSLPHGRAFCAAYTQELRPARDNPKGVQLTRADLQMLRSLLPWPLRLLGLGVAPRVYLVRLLGVDAAARVGVTPVTGHDALAWLIPRLPLWWNRLWRTALPDANAHAELSRLFFRMLIVDAWGDDVRFLLPADMQDLRRLA